MRRSLLVAVLVVACCAIIAQAQIGPIGRPLGGLPQPVTNQIGAVGTLAAQQPALIPQQQFAGIGGVQQPFAGVQQQQPFMQQPFMQQQQQQQPFVQQQPLQFGGGLPLGGGAVLPQNFQQPIAGQLNQPVLSPQQAAQLIPIDQMQAALNQRVAASGQLGVMPPAQLPVGMGGVGIQQVQQPAFGQQQQQLPMQFGGVGIQQGQIPYPATSFGGFQQQMPMGVGAFPQQQQGLQMPTMGQTAPQLGGAQLPNLGAMQMPQMPTIGGF